MKSQSKVTIVNFAILLVLLIIVAGINYTLWLNIQPYDRIMSVVVSCFVLITIAQAVTLRRNYIPSGRNDTDALDEDSYKRIYNAKEIWKISYVIWIAIYYLLAGLSVLSSIIVVYIAGTDFHDASLSVIIYSILSIVFTFTSALLRPSDQAAGYRRAFEDMNIVMFNYVQKKSNSDDLIECLKRCESYITSKMFP